jgi:uncharacterized membrane protein (UPF0127 family)
MKLVNLSNGEMISHHVMEAQTFWKRFKGLMFSKQLPPGWGLHIQPCLSIHTFFMNYAIDILHLDSDHNIVATEENLAPRRIGKKVKGTISVVELPAGSIQQSGTKVGQAVQFEQN